ncbi:protein of unknown function [Sterolibacterium denitrificans]|uniref:Uncharacterized protein n=1 Tax=Sterolibacterium denitrificans TaxID=157592 RepID=A0A7Z7HRH5_9PROT|nr:protein of unknown function [Sterolibacterium denitrificans]
MDATLIFHRAQELLKDFFSTELCTYKGISFSLFFNCTHECFSRRV